MNGLRTMVLMVAFIPYACTDGLPALALSVEAEEGSVMKRPPRHPKESIFSGGLGIHALWVGLLMAAIVLFVQAGR